VEKQLIIHLGLHKTGTTTMQTHFFSQFQGYQGKNPHAVKKDIQSSYPLFTHAFDQFLRNRPFESFLVGWLETLNFAECPVRIVCEENLSSWPNPLNGSRTITAVHKPEAHDLPRQGAHPHLTFLKKIQELMPDDVTIKTIITIRSQSDYLGSLAAQFGALRPNAIMQAIEARDASINFHRIICDLENFLRPANHLTLLFEDGMTKNCQKILDFMELPQELTPSRIMQGKALNVRRLTSDSWASNPDAVFRQWSIYLLAIRIVQKRFPKARTGLRFLEQALVKLSPKRSGVIRVSAEDRNAIQLYCRESNELLAKHLGRDLRSLGY
jgi:hypothetical protein